MGDYNCNAKVSLVNSLNDPIMMTFTLKIHLARVIIILPEDHSIYLLREASNTATVDYNSKEDFICAECLGDELNFSSDDAICHKIDPP